MENNIQALRDRVYEQGVRINQLRAILNVGYTETHKIHQLESLIDRQTIALETTYSKITNLENKVSQLERKLSINY